jgi:hypothetical protein
MHFLRMKEQIQSAFELKPPGKTHGAPHLRNEFQQLLRMHREDELHRFRPGRTNGHAAVNFFAKGYEALEEGKIADFIAQSTAYADVTADALNPEISRTKSSKNLWTNSLRRQGVKQWMRTTWMINQNRNTAMGTMMRLSEAWIIRMTTMKKTVHSKVLSIRMTT